jgi:hypothetical protein
MPETPLKSEETMYRTGTAKKTGIQKTLIQVNFSDSQSNGSSEKQQQIKESIQPNKADGETQTTEQTVLTGPVDKKAAITVNELFNYNLSSKLRASPKKNYKLP